MLNSLTACSGLGRFGVLIQSAYHARLAAYYKPGMEKAESELRLLGAEIEAWELARSPNLFAPWQAAEAQRAYRKEKAKFQRLSALYTRHTNAIAPPKFGDDERWLVMVLAFGLLGGLAGIGIGKLLF